MRSFDFNPGLKNLDISHRKYGAEATNPTITANLAAATHASVNVSWMMSPPAASISALESEVNCSNILEKLTTAITMNMTATIETLKRRRLSSDKCSSTDVALSLMTLTQNRQNHSSFFHRLRVENRAGHPVFLPQLRCLTNLIAVSSTPSY